jgi:hypothetical protein
MDILKILPGGKFVGSEIIETANTEVECHIQMIVLNNASHLNYASQVVIDISSDLIKLEEVG